MEKESSTQSDLLLRLVSEDEEQETENFLKIYSTLDSLKSCEEYQEEFPLILEIADTDEYISGGEGFGLSVEQAEELISALQGTVDFLRNEV